MRQFEGSCHCEKVRIVFETDRDPESYEPRVCNCDFCRRHGSAAIADPQGRLILHLASDHVPYRFGLNMTDFHVCNSCGVFVAASWADGDRLIGAVNVNVLDDTKAFSGNRVGMNFEGEDRAVRAKRRRANWTPAVKE